MKRITNIFNYSTNKNIPLQHKISEFSKSLSLIVDFDQLKVNVISKLNDIISARSILLFLINTDLNRFELTEERGFERNDKLFFLPDEPLINWFSVNETHLSISDNPKICEYFNEYEREIIKKTKTKYIFPLIAMNHITGLICLGEKLDSSIYTEEEKEYLALFFGQTALAFENAYLYKQQKLRLKKMYRSDRLATLGQLAAGAAHEIRNPLTSVRSTIQYLQKGIKEENKQQMFTNLIEEVDRINQIVEGLLKFSKPVKPKKENINLEELIKKTLSLIESTAKKCSIDINLQFNGNEKYLNADPNQLKQMFLNIFINSIDSMKTGGKLSLNIDNTFSNDSEENKFLIIIKDTGNGIPSKNLESIFDPFFTTKEEGTGLGLSISYRIVQQHQGDIEIESKIKNDINEESGTVVTIILPIGTVN